MNFGNLFGGVAQGADEALNRERKSALELKLESAKLDMEHKNRMAELQTPLSKGATDAVGEVLGKDLTGITKADEPMISAALQAKAAQAQLGMGHVFKTKTEVDPSSGIPTHIVGLNAYDTELPNSRIPLPNATQNIQDYQKYKSLVEGIGQTKALYDRLDVHSAMGTGGLMNHLPNTSYTQDRTQLLAKNDQISLLAGQLMDGVPGGRASLGLAGFQQGYLIKPEYPEKLAQDIHDNLLFQSYRRLEGMAPGTIKLPQQLEVFKGVPHDSYDNPVNVYFDDGKAYLDGHNDPDGKPISVFDLKHPKPAVHTDVLRSAVNSQKPTNEPSASDFDAWNRANPEQ